MKSLFHTKSASGYLRIVLFLFFTLPAVVQAQFTYTINNGAISITITGYTGPSGAVVIPNTINGYNVTSIGNDAFFEITSLTSVAIPAGVTNIGNDAFHYCSGLTDVTIPDGVTNIGQNAFAYCTSLTGVTIPDSVVSIGDGAFAECGSLDNVKISDGVTTIADSAFMGCGLTNLVIPNSVTNIQGFAFFGCPLASLTIPSHVTSIGEEAFFSCTNLTGITIPGSVTSLGQRAFASCLNLASAYFLGNAPFDDGTAFTSDRNATVYYLPGTFGWGATFGSVPTMEGTPPYQFTWVTNNNSITITGYTGPGGVVAIPATINGYGVTDIGQEAFAENTNLTSITIFNGVTNIEFSAFSSCISLTNVVLPNSIVSIGDESFIDCSSLIAIRIPNSVTSIGDSAFASCTSLGSITIPNSVTHIGVDTFSIGVDTFSFCTNMTNIIVNAGNPVYSSLNGVLFDKAGDTLLECPSGLTNRIYHIPDGVVTMTEDAFFYCQNLASVTIPGSLTNIIGPPFYDCANLTDIGISTTNPAYCVMNDVLFDKAKSTLIQYPPGLVNDSYTIPDSVTTIQGDAFSFCANLVSITIPNGVTSIGWGEFQGCSSLAGIIIPNGVTNIPVAAFENCSSLTSVVIPNSVTSIGFWAFQGCSSLTNIIIPASVTDIGFLAFLDCSNLTAAYFQGNAPADGGGAFGGTPAIVYYLPGTFGWGTTYGNVPTALWFQPQPQVLAFEPSFGMKNNQFSFTISWATNASVIVQACTNLTNPNWILVATNAMSNGTNYFSDPQSANYPYRFYRVSAP